jgi:hypothetical protein
MKEERRKFKKVKKVEDERSSQFESFLVKKHIRNHFLSETNCGVMFFVCSNRGVCRKEPMCANKVSQILWQACPICPD